MSEYNIQMNKYNALNAGYDQLYPATKIENVDGLNTALQKKAEFILLWENASPSSDFAAQTVALDLSVYDFIFVEGRGCGVWTCRVGGEARLVTNHSGVLWRTRQFTAYEHGVAFNDAYQGYYSQEGAVSNSDCIPLYIYGIKGVSV